MADSIRRDQAAWLLGTSAILAVVLWFLPVPPFIFAQQGSGSTASCTCSVDNCSSWAMVDEEGTPDCNNKVWEDCSKDKLGAGHKVNCGKVQKVLPRSIFTYEKTRWCSNTKSHADENDSGDIVEWQRLVAAAGGGDQSQDKKIQFKPKLRLSFLGFDGPNVCIPCPPSEAQIIIESGFFARMIVCDQDKVDPNKGDAGWVYVVHIFECKDNAWRFTSSAKNPHVETFNISATCPCNNVGDITEFITFSSRVNRNTGVKFGAAESKAVVYYEAADDETTCTDAP